MDDDDVDGHTILECALSTAHPIWRDFQPWFYHVINWYILILSSYRSTVIYHTLIKYQHFSIVSMYVSNICKVEKMATNDALPLLKDACGDVSANW